MLSRQLETRPKVVLDTNNLVSAQINKKGASFKIFNLFEKEKISLYTSPFQLQEFKKVLSYQRIKGKYKLTDQKIETIIRIIERHVFKVYPSKIPQIIAKDKDDNQILAIALEGKTDFIVSGDEHLLSLKKFKRIPIVSAKEFLQGALSRPGAS